MDEAKQAKQVERSPTEAQVNETKITSVEKAKDPKRVEAGKKLGAMSKQAKEKKASQRIEIEDEFKVPSFDSIDPLAVVGVLGVVGVIVYYKYFSKKKSNNPTPEPQAEQTEDSTPEPKQAKTERKKLDSLD